MMEPMPLTGVMGQDYPTELITPYPPTSPFIQNPNNWAGVASSPPVPNRVDAVLQNIQLLLNNYLNSAGINVETHIFPDQPVDEWWNGPTPAYLLIAYRSSHFERPKATSGMVQHRTFVVDIDILARQIEWSAKGGFVYVLMAAIQQALAGASIPGCRYLYFLDETFEEQDPQGRIWRYAMTMEITTFQLAVSPDESTLATLKELWFLEGANQTTKAQSSQYTFNSAGELQLGNMNVFNVIMSNPVTGKVYLYMIDFTFDPLTGLVTTIENGAIPAGATVNIQYQYNEVTGVISGNGSNPGNPTNVVGPMVIADSINAPTD